LHAVGPDTLPSGLPIDEFLLRLLDADSLLSERLFSEKKESFVPWPTAAGEECFRFAVTFARAADERGVQSETCGALITQTEQPPVKTSRDVLLTCGVTHCRGDERQKSLCTGSDRSPVIDQMSSDGDKL
jgi:hypothetical protein